MSERIFGTAVSESVPVGDGLHEVMVQVAVPPVECVGCRELKERVAALEAMLAIERLPTWKDKVRAVLDTAERWDAKRTVNEATTLALEGKPPEPTP